MRTMGPSLRRVSVSADGGARSYPVVVGRGALGRLPELVQPILRPHRWAVVADETVAAHYGAQVVDALRECGGGVDLFTFPPGEQNKTREQWVRITDELLLAGHARDSAVAALGGGVAGDLAGFVAATFMRGVPLVQIATSLVAMVDASVGGKTGVDTPAGKNLVGAFHPPRLVVSDPETVATLPVSERSRGLIEAVKHGAILDEEYLTSLEKHVEELLSGDPAILEDAVHRSVELKAGVVARDEREEGARQILNFGHTLGHALEAASDYRLSHGSAVGIGMVLEARLGERMDVTAPGTSKRLSVVVRALGLPAAPPEWLDLNVAEGFLSRDKKRRSGQVRFVLLREAGAVYGDGEWSHPVAPETIHGLLVEATLPRA